MIVPSVLEVLKKLVDMVWGWKWWLVLGWWLDLMVFDIFSSINYSIKFSLLGLLGSTEEQHQAPGLSQHRKTPKNLSAPPPVALVSPRNQNWKTQARV